jgi:hypothetical protein
MKSTTPQIPMVCKLTNPELSKRKKEVIAKLKEQIQEKKELPNGFSYQFNGTDEMLDTLIAFIKSERQCCTFFNFNLLLNKEATVWLEITGDDGAKTFISTELGM